METPDRSVKEAEADDNELIRAVLSGERGAIDRLVNRHKDRLFNLCFWFLGDYWEADDICQEVFIKIYTSLNRFRFESSFATWSYRIAVNTCKNRMKSLGYRVRKWTAQLDAADAMPEDTALNRGPGEDAQQVLEKRECAQAIQQALKLLPPDKKTVLVLRDIEGLSYESISEITQVPVGTVKSRLARARNDLKKKLSGFF